MSKELAVNHTAKKTWQNIGGFFVPPRVLDSKVRLRSAAGRHKAFNRYQLQRESLACLVGENDC